MSYILLLRRRAVFITGTAKKLSDYYESMTLHHGVAVYYRMNNGTMVGTKT